VRGHLQGVPLGAAPEHLHDRRCAAHDERRRGQCGALSRSPRKAGPVGLAWRARVPGSPLFFWARRGRPPGRRRRVKGLSPIPAGDRPLQSPVVPRTLDKDSTVFISEAFAQAAPAAGGTESGLLGILPMVLLFVVLYFVMIRPQMKRQKEQKTMIEALAKGDEVVTAGGLVGKISKLGDSYLHLEVANGVELQVQRGSVVQVLPKGTVK